MTTANKTVTLTLNDFEHICAALGDHADKFAEMSRDAEFAQKESGCCTPENQKIWGDHAEYLYGLHRMIKDQTGLPR